MLTAQKTREYERTLGMLAKYKMGPRAPFDCPLAVDLNFFLTQPDRFRKRSHPDVKMDIDNLIKATLDAFNGVLWTDDGRVCELNARKQWGSPCVSIRIYSILQRWA